MYIFPVLLFNKSYPFLFRIFWKKTLPSTRSSSWRMSRSNTWRPSWSSCTPARSTWPRTNCPHSSRLPRGSRLKDWPRPRKPSRQSSFVALDQETKTKTFLTTESVPLPFFLSTPFPNVSLWKVKQKVFWLVWGY